MTRPRCTWIGALGAALASLSTVAAAPGPVWVWYRTSEGCPDGESFIARLNGLGQSARLARVGDRVDFVVTLGHERSRSSGRLERQTRGGTVAIREYQDADCAQVADALALTLDLALDPEGVPAADASLGEPTTAEAPSMTPRVPTSTSELGITDAPGSPSKLESAPRASVTVGAQATLASGVAPDLLPGGALFVALGGSDRAPMPARLTLLGGHAESTASGRELAVTLLGVRAEVCPLGWTVSSALVLEPCGAAEAGLVRGAGNDPTRSADSGFWSSVMAHGRLALRVQGPLWLEAQVGARVPLVRYDMGTRDGSENWFRTRAVGLDAAVGAAWQIW